MSPPKCGSVPPTAPHPGVLDTRGRLVGERGRPELEPASGQERRHLQGQEPAQDSGKDADHDAGTPTDRGMVTAEAALGLIALVAVLALCLAAVQYMVAQLRTQEALRAAAREIARGATVTDAKSAAERAVRGSVDVLVADEGVGGGARDSSLKRVEVRRAVTAAMPRAPTMLLRASVVTAVEGVGPGTAAEDAVGDDPWP